MNILRVDAVQLPLVDQSVDLVFGSPPYCDARTYSIGAQRGCAEWIDWMLAVSDECLRACKGAVAWVAAGVTRKRSYWPAVEGLMYRWWAEGHGTMYRPCCWHRSGIPGSGGDQWFRADWEYVICLKREGPLPWTDPTACGGTPQYAIGGQLSYRTVDGARINAKKSRRNRDKGAKLTSDTYVHPDRTNPGTVITTRSGGGALGNALAHSNEAPFPEKLAERFVLSLCPPDGVVLDPFSGSGTTAAVAQRYGRRFVASDIRQSQCELTRRRLDGNQLALRI